MLRFLSVLLLVFAAGMAVAGMPAQRFASIDGGTIDLGDWAGRPVLVVNTASRCGYTYQYQGLQDLYDRYRDRGLVVLAVPSDDFRQELGSAREVKDFCELTFGIDLPMTDITHVRGAKAHPFYRQLREEVGFVPSWNFNKILIAPDGRVVRTWGSGTKPMSREIVGAVEALLD
ncbi:glutathione peroxidase [Sulfitobacter sp. LCG007]